MSFFSLFVGVVLRIKFVNLIVKAIPFKSRAAELLHTLFMLGDHLADIIHSVGVLKPDLDAVESDA